MQSLHTYSFKGKILQNFCKTRNALRFLSVGNEKKHVYGINFCRDDDDQIDVW